ncbi:hypothetical protein ABVT39_018243 [Epinephelus coioides]
MRAHWRGSRPPFASVCLCSRDSPRPLLLTATTTRNSWSFRRERGHRGATRDLTDVEKTNSICVIRELTQRGQDNSNTGYCMSSVSAVDGHDLISAAKVETFN